jgi:hypothetical protein
MRDDSDADADRVVREHIRGLPLAVQQLVQESLATMYSASSHRLSVQWRRKLYEALASSAAEPGARAQGWLAILAAQWVFPLVQQALPQVALPGHLLALAEDVMQGKLSATDSAVEEALNDSYLAMGNPSGFEDHHSVAVNAAAYACRKALGEACGYQPLKYLDEVAARGTDGTWIPASQWTDEMLAHDETGDTAATAAIAAATDVEANIFVDPHPRCDPLRLQVFWTWWLLEAIPAAWVKAGE